MQLENNFTVPLPIDEAWRVLLDIERIAPCMPGAALDSVDGDDFTGRVKVKLGPINLTYQGKGSFIEKDDATHRAVIDARGKDQRGNGTASAIVTATLAAQGDSTRVDVLTDLNITGRPAQFGRGVMTDVGNKLLGQFADKLAAQLGEGDAQGDADRAAAAAAAAPVAAAAPAAAAPAAATPAAEAEPTSSLPGAETSAGPVRAAAAAVAGAVEEAAAGLESAQGDGAVAGAARSAGGPARSTAAKAADAVAEPAAEQPAATTGAGSDPDSGTVPALVTVHGAKAPSRPPSGTTAPPSRPGTSGPERSTPGQPARPRPVSDPEPIDLLEVAGGAAFSRFAAPAAGVAAVLVLLSLLLRRRRR